MAVGAALLLSLVLLAVLAAPGRSGSLDSVSLRLTKGADPEKVIQELRAIVPADATVAARSSAVKMPSASRLSYGRKSSASRRNR